MLTFVHGHWKHFCLVLPQMDDLEEVKAAQKQKMLGGAPNGLVFHFPTRHTS